jgi:hypothetical protein
LQILIVLPVSGDGVGMPCKPPSKTSPIECDHWGEESAVVTRSIHDLSRSFRDEVHRQKEAACCCRGPTPTPATSELALAD